LIAREQRAYGHAEKKNSDGQPLIHRSQRIPVMSSSRGNRASVRKTEQGPLPKLSRYSFRAKLRFTFVGQKDYAEFQTKLEYRKGGIL
jgi:hypothetical protein